MSSFVRLPCPVFENTTHPTLQSQSYAATAAGFRELYCCKLERRIWKLEIYFINCLMEELGVSFDSITTEAVCTYSLHAVSPYPFLSSSLRSVMVARASLAPISRSGLFLNKLVKDSPRMQGNQINMLPFHLTSALLKQNLRAMPTRKLML